MKWAKKLKQLGDDSHVVVVPDVPEVEPTFKHVHTDHIPPPQPDIKAEKLTPQLMIHTTGALSGKLEFEKAIKHATMGMIPKVASLPPGSVKKSDYDWVEVPDGNGKEETKITASPVSWSDIKTTKINLDSFPLVSGTISGSQLTNTGVKTKVDFAAALWALKDAGLMVKEAQVEYSNAKHKGQVTVVFTAWGMTSEHLQQLHHFLTQKGKTP